MFWVVTVVCVELDKKGFEKLIKCENPERDKLHVRLQLTWIHDVESVQFELLHYFGWFCDCYLLLSFLVLFSGSIVCGFPPLLRSIYIMIPGPSWPGCTDLLFCFFCAKTFFCFVKKVWAVMNQLSQWFVHDNKILLNLKSVQF